MSNNYYFQNNQIKLLFTVLYKVSNIIYHNLQKQFVTDVVNAILNNIANNSYSNKNTGIINYNNYLFNYILY